MLESFLLGLPLRCQHKHSLCQHKHSSLPNTTLKTCRRWKLLHKQMCGRAGQKCVQCVCVKYLKRKCITWPACVVDMVTLPDQPYQVVVVKLKELEN